MIKDVLGILVMTAITTGIIFAIFMAVLFYV
jgi:hypothetical protein